MQILAGQSRLLENSLSGCGTGVGFYMDARNTVLNQHINPVQVSTDSGNALPLLEGAKADRTTNKFKLVVLHLTL